MKKFLGVAYLTELDGFAAIDEELKVQRALAEALQQCGVKKYIVVPEDLLSDAAQRGLAASGEDVF